MVIMRSFAFLFAYSACTICGRRASLISQHQNSRKGEELVTQLLALRGSVAGWQASGHGPPLAAGANLALPTGVQPARMSGTAISMQQKSFGDVRPMATASTISRRAVLALSLLLMAPHQVRGAETEQKDQLNYRGDGKIVVEIDGVKKLVTPIEARALLDEKVKEMTAKGKGIDLERRGKNNEKAIFPDDFYKQWQIRPTPEDVLNNPQFPFVNPKATMPFIAERQRLLGYDTYEKPIKAAIDLYGNALKAAIAAESWSEVQTLLQLKDGKEVKKDSKLRRFPYQLGSISNKLLQSDDDSVVNSFNKIARYLINELYFAEDDIVAAAKTSDTEAAKAAWEKGASNMNVVLKILNYQLTESGGVTCEPFAFVAAGSSR